jgi:hypothetical protein
MNMLRNCLAFVWRVARAVLVGFIAIAAVIVIGIASLEAWKWFTVPPIIRSVTPGFFQHGVPNQEDAFRQRVKAAFPDTMAESDLIAQLQHQGFDGPFPTRSGKSVTFEHASFPCRLTWSISWHTEEPGLASKVDAKRTAVVCF